MGGLIDVYQTHDDSSHLHISTWSCSHAYYGTFVCGFPQKLYLYKPFKGFLSKRNEGDRHEVIERFGAAAFRHRGNRSLVPQVRNTL